MQTNDQDKMAGEATQAPQRAGFFTNIMPVLGRDGETVYFFLPGDMTVTEHANRFKGLLGLDYQPKAQTERMQARKRYGFFAKVRVGLSQDGEWVTLYLPGNLGRIVNHRNAYLHAFKLPYEKKARTVA